MDQGDRAGDHDLDPEVKGKSLDGAKLLEEAKALVAKHEKA